MILGYLRLDWQVPDKPGMFRLDLASIVKQIAQRRKTFKLSQGELSIKAGVSRATQYSLEHARAGELSFSKLTMTSAMP